MDKKELNKFYGALCEYIDTDSVIANADKDAVHVRYPHIGRMLVEHNELLKRIAKLDNYYEDHIHELTTPQATLMGRQLTAMRAYADLLRDRIKYDVRYYSKK